MRSVPVRQRLREIRHTRRRYTGEDGNRRRDLKMLNTGFDMEESPRNPKRQGMDSLPEPLKGV